MTISLSSFVDTLATLDEHPVNKIIRDAVQLQTFGEPKDILKLYIGLAGIQHSGVCSQFKTSFKSDFLLDDFL